MIMIRNQESLYSMINDKEPRKKYNLVVAQASILHGSGLIGCRAWSLGVQLGV